jgi:hypothetical protein
MRHSVGGLVPIEGGSAVQNKAATLAIHRSEMTTHNLKSTLDIGDPIGPAGGHSEHNFPIVQRGFYLIARIVISSVFESVTNSR